MDIETFWTLFVHRSDVFAEQQENGAYIPQDEKLTDEVIEQHLEGERTIGLYQLDGSTIKWAVLDIDLHKDIWSQEDFDVTEWDEPLKKQAEKAQELLLKEGIPSYIEHSGHKGYHVWVFFEHPVEAGPVKDGMEEIFDQMDPTDEHIEWEIFPKQSRVREGSYGNLMKAPAGYHHKSGEFSQFDEDLDAESVQYGKATFFFDAEPYKMIKRRCVAIGQAWDEAVKEGHADHNLRLAIGNLYCNLGKEARQFVIDEFFAKMDDYKPDYTRYQLDQLQQKQADEDDPTAPITCKTLQSKDYQICPSDCEAIGKGNSPIAFYHRAKRGESGDGSSSESRRNNVKNRLDKYFQEGNCYYMEMQDGGIKQLSSFIVDIEEVVTIDDGVQQETRYRGTIKSEFGEESEFDIKAEEYSDKREFQSMIYKHLSPNSLLINNLHDIRLAINKHANAKQKKINKQFGYEKDDEDDSFPERYVSPSVIIDKSGIRNNDDRILDLSDEENASYLDLANISDDKFKKVINIIKDNLMILADFESTHSCLAHTFLPIIFPFIQAGDDRRYTFFLRGETGMGKSYLLEQFQHFYGDFSDDMTSWVSTSNAISRIGYFFKDALFVVDDFKRSNFRNSREYSNAIGLIQTFADGASRSRMQKNLKMAKKYPVRGWLTSTGEDTPEGESSSLARMLTVTLRVKEKKLKAGKKCDHHKHLFKGVTPRYIYEIIRKNPAHISKIYHNYHDEFFKIIKGESNDVRISRNYALLCTSHKFISDFVYSKKEAEKKHKKFVKMKKESIKYHAKETKQELASERFLDILSELFSTKQVRLQETSGHDNPPASIQGKRAEVIGYWGKPDKLPVSKPIVHIIPQKAYNQVQSYLRKSNDQLNHSKKAIVRELYENGLCFDAQPVRRIMNKENVNVIRLAEDIFSDDEVRGKN